MRKVISCLLAVALFAPRLFAATRASDGSAANTQTQINASSGGDTVTLPVGTFTWGQNVACNKAITIVGAGSGRIIGRSTSTVTVGTGSKTFTTQAGLAIAVGDIIRVERIGFIGNFMQGNVTAYSGTTLTINSTTTGGSGSQKLWIISTQPKTTIVHNAGSGAVLSLDESTAGRIDVSGIQWKWGGGSGDMVEMNRVNNGIGINVHDCWFRSGQSDCIDSDTLHGVVWECSFDSSPFSMAPLAVHLKDCPTNAWQKLSFMGTNDVAQTNNFYVENCDFHAWLNAADNDDSGRLVWRRNLMNNAGMGTHGADTSNYGQRHFEAYDCTFVFNGYADGTTFNLNWWFFIRGGTGVITDNIMPNIDSTDYGDKLEVNMIVMNLQRAGGPHPCYTANAAISYPCPRQVGVGRVTGLGTYDSITYNGDTEALYVWNNGTTYGVSTTDYGGSDCNNPHTSAQYVVHARDFFTNGTAKPDYMKSTWPNTNRTGAVVIVYPVITSAVVETNGTTWTLNFSEAVTIGAGGNGGFTVATSAGTAPTLTYSSGAGTAALVYTGSRAMTYFEFGTISYVQPGNGVEDLDGNDLASFSTYSFLNTVTQVSDTNTAPRNLRLRSN